LTGASAVRLPNFFVAGAPKAGTTSLYFYLDQHPQVYMSAIKEPGFFGAADLQSAPYRDQVLRYLERHRTIIRNYLDGPQTQYAQYAILEWEDYLTLFRDARDETAVGEASVDYFWQPSAARAIRAKVPDARLIFVLRDPAELLLSRYVASLWRNPRSTFREWFLAAQASPNPWFVPLGPGRYATNLQRFFDAFGRDQIRIHLYEDYRREPRSVLRDVFAFLGVDPDYPVDLSRRHNETLVPRFPLLHTLRRRIFGGGPVTGWLPPGVRRLVRGAYNRPRGVVAMDADDHRMVADYYRAEILRAADLIGRDLSAWLR
jgi:hypothetical protein